MIPTDIKIQLVNEGGDVQGAGSISLQSLLDLHSKHGSEGVGAALLHMTILLGMEWPAEPPLVEQLNRSLDEKKPIRLQFKTYEPRNVPDWLKAAANHWLTVNEKTAADVEHALFPIGFVGTMVELAKRARTLETSFQKVYADCPACHGTGKIEDDCVSGYSVLPEDGGPARCDCPANIILKLTTEVKELRQFVMEVRSGARAGTVVVGRAGDLCTKYGIREG